MSLKVKYFAIVMAALICMAMVDVVSAEPPSILSARTDSGKIAFYEKFELKIDLKATYSNPFYPAQINLNAEFTSPSGNTWNTWFHYYISMADTIPELRTTGGHALNIGNDVAFKIVPK
jgi:hypothetical protein